MSIVPTPSPSQEPSGSLSDVSLWLVIGTAGVAIFYAASVHLPLEWKVLGVYPVALGAIAGWGLGQWGVIRRLRASGLVMVLVWLLIVAGEALAAVQTQRAGMKPARSGLKPEQLDRDMLNEAMREYFAREPDGLSDEQREQWRTDRDNFERGEQRLREELEARRLHRSFYGYLANRIPKEWGQWSAPWPALFWGAEVLLGSALGTWLAFLTLRSASPPAGNPAASEGQVKEISRQP